HDHADEPAFAALVSCFEIFVYANRNGSHSVLCPFKVVLIDHHAYAAPASIFEAAHHASPAVDLHPLSSAQDFSRQQDREIHHRPDRNVIVHRKQHAVRRDVFRLCRIGRALRFHRRRQMQRKPWSTLHVFVVSRVHLLLGRRWVRFRFHFLFALFRPPFAPELLLLTSQPTPLNLTNKVTEVMEQSELTTYP